jgi:hypothetical protein
MDSLLANEIGQLIANLGAERVVFGTGMPFNYPDLALLKLEVLAASRDDRKRSPGGTCGAWLPEAMNCEASMCPLAGS